MSIELVIAAEPHDDVWPVDNKGMFVVTAFSGLKMGQRVIMDRVENFTETRRSPLAEVVEVKPGLSDHTSHYTMRWVKPA